MLMIAILDGLGDWQVKPLVKWGWLGAVLLVAACALPGTMPPGTPFSAVTLPPLSSDLARIYFYREYEPFESLAAPWVSLNGRETVLSIPGGVSYRDVPPGEYHITVLSPGIYPDQFKTVKLGAGEKLYVEIQSLYSWDEGRCWDKDTFVVALIGAAQAKAEIADLNYVSGI
jgi:hypothetical protein